MRARTLLWMTAIVSSILSGGAVYLALTIPNDLKADAMLKTSRQQITKGDNSAARDSLARIVQQYPRTDAAAAATVALVRIAEQERAQMASEVAQLRAENAQNTKAIDDLRASLDAVKAAPPNTIIVQAPVAKPAVVKKPPATKKSTTKRRRH